MRVYSRTIPYSKPGEKFWLVPFGCVHYGAAACEKTRFTQTLRHYGRKPNTMLIALGDMVDCIVAKDHKRFRPSCIDPDMLAGNVAQEDWIDQQVNWFCSQMESYVDPDNLLGIGRGNHEDAILKYHSTDPARRIAQRLDTGALGYTFFYHLNFKREGTGYQKLIVYGNHGFGGGTRTEGGSMTRYCRHAERMHADICLYAHDHDAWVKPIVEVDSSGGKVREVIKLVVDCGTFLKTFSDSDVPTYSEQAGYPPRNLGCPVIEITTPTDTDGFKLKGTV